MHIEKVQVGLPMPFIAKPSEELQNYRNEGVLTVEMEAAALFAVGQFRNVHVSSVFAISDILSEVGWNQGYHSSEKLIGLKQIFVAALSVLSLN